MNKQLNLAVAAAVLAFSASANAGITIPAGDWTVDIGGNMNAFYTHTQSDVTTAAGVKTSAADSNTVGTGLLPSAFGIGAKSRQNDLDVAFQFSFFTGTAAGTGAAAGNNSLNIRQAFLSFGDASWGTIKMGRDLGVFGSDAILSDMTLLGVGVGGPASGSSTLGRIGSGYIYADWVGQIQYASPNWNGFSFTAAISEPLDNGVSLGTTKLSTREDMGFEGKVDYDFSVSDVTGRVWLGGISQEHSNGTFGGYTSEGWELGGKAAAYGFGLVGYYYSGDGLDSQNGGVAGGLKFASGQKTDDNGGYVQGTYTIPGIGTKLGASWGTSNSKGQTNAFDIENESWIIGAYHPLTKSLNLVAEYTSQEIKNSVATGTATAKTENDTVSLGAIMFF
ncbi:MAG TPA: porin [Methylophilaceae bacterium]|jgi:predicted porin